MNIKMIAKVTIKIIGRVLSYSWYSARERDN